MHQRQESALIAELVVALHRVSGVFSMASDGLAPHRVLALVNNPSAAIRLYTPFVVAQGVLVGAEREVSRFNPTRMRARVETRLVAEDGDTRNVRLHVNVYAPNEDEWDKLFLDHAFGGLLTHMGYEGVLRPHFGTKGTHALLWDPGTFVRLVKRTSP